MVPLTRWANVEYVVILYSNTSGFAHSPIDPFESTNAVIDALRGRFDGSLLRLDRTLCYIAAAALEGCCIRRPENSRVCLSKLIKAEWPTAYRRNGDWDPV